MTDDDQRLIALAKANETRHLRAELKRDLRTGRVPLEQLLLSPPEWLRTQEVYAMLLALPRVGHRTALDAMSRAEVPLSVTFGRLTVSWRRRLLAELSRTVARRWL
jgi:hypothetical protein